MVLYYCLKLLFAYITVLIVFLTRGKYTNVLCNHNRLRRMLRGNNHDFIFTISLHSFFSNIKGHETMKSLVACMDCFFYDNVANQFANDWSPDCKYLRLDFRTLWELRRYYIIKEFLNKSGLQGFLLGKELLLFVRF